MITLYKRNAQGKPLFWSIDNNLVNIVIQYGIVGKQGRTEYISVHRNIIDEINSLVKAKRKEGYKELQDLYDNAPKLIEQNNLYDYLNTYLPKFNTHSDGAFIPMLCKTLEDNKPFERGTYFGQWKINGERCIITATVERGLFELVKLHYRSREGVDWTNKLSYLDDILLPCIPDEIINMMVEEGVGLDGELYLPGYGINEINSFIKNTELPQHYKLQFWLYDICIENMTAWNRQIILLNNFSNYRINSVFNTKGCVFTKEDHFNNTNRLVLLSNDTVENINIAIGLRDRYISLGFEGLIIRKQDAEYQFGGRRNNSMLKFKKKEDGLFTIVDVVPEGKKRYNLGKFVLKNDINNELFECTYNAPHSAQEEILINKNKYIGHYKALVEFRERSGITQVPFHAKCVKLVNT
ncbi:MAG: ATP-dependent DNA ligase [crAssphage sp. isolate ctcc615]|uniref:DNA ligase n=1 Tax=crAssphage sp. isolate ctcc615 TaxID=2989853 RepID=A0A345BP41_9CAUD|nr:MAG: ATP-dependent DNA ligase [crAssphage sp. isolate ctcc615]AXF52212.1 MAG: ATP-dependent DNA ligase [crAssphage sp. isolate ctcc615]